MKKNKTKNMISAYLVFSLTFFILLFLGVWQLNKHKIQSYNQNLLLTKIKEDAKELDNLKLNIDNIEIINVKGMMLEENSLFFEPRTYKGKIGYHKLVPLKVGDKYVLVNRGFTKDKKIESEKTIKKINGLAIKFPNPNFYELENDIKNNRWYTLNLEQISAFLNIKLEPLLIYEMNSSSKEIINVKPNIVSNINHLNYALTWFMLAISLSVILIIHVRKI